MARRLAARLLGMLGALCLSAPAEEQGLANIEPLYSIRDVVLGEPATQIPAMEVSQISCGANGGPPSKPVKDFAAFLECPREASSLHEVHFAYDDESDYIAKALELEYKALQGGTSIYAHPLRPV